MWHIREARKKINMSRDVVKNWIWGQKGEMELHLLLIDCK